MNSASSSFDEEPKPTNHFTRREKNEFAYTDKETDQSPFLLRNMLLLERKLKLKESQVLDVCLQNEILAKENEILKEKSIRHFTILKMRNHKSQLYGHFNSHTLRAPVATILGLISIMYVTKDFEEMQGLIKMLEKTTRDLDSVVKFIQPTVSDVE